MKKIVVLVAMLCIILQVLTAQTVDEARVQVAVNQQMKDYPLSSLQDIYKNFFQDVLGPGHLLSNTTAAKEYLEQELEDYSGTQPYHKRYYEAIGYSHNYYRVNLAVVWDGLVSKEELFAAFFESAQSITPDIVEKWRKEWIEVEAIINNMNLGITHYDEDKTAIDTMLHNGKYMMRHSKTYNDNYHPHYRIIEKKIFHEKILPLIKE